MSEQKTGRKKRMAMDREAIKVTGSGRCRADMSSAGSLTSTEDLRAIHAAFQASHPRSDIHGQWGAEGRLLGYSNGFAVSLLFAADRPGPMQPDRTPYTRGRTIFVYAENVFGEGQGFRQWARGTLGLSAAAARSLAAEIQQLALLDMAKGVSRARRENGQG